MVDPWGPGLRRKVRSVDSYVKSWNALSTTDWQISAVFDKRSPVYLQEQLAIILNAMDSAGNLHNLVNTSGELVVEDMATTKSYANMIRYPSADLPTFRDWTADAPRRQQIGRRYFSVPLTEAAGAIAATTIVPALADYTGHCTVQGIWAPAGTTDAANTWTFTVAAGTILGPDVFAMNITASRYHNILAGAAGIYAPPLLIRGTIAADDNKAIQVAAANLAAVGIDYYIDGVYWYET